MWSPFQSLLNLINSYKNKILIQCNFISLYHHPLSSDLHYNYIHIHHLLILFILFSKIILLNLKDNFPPKNLSIIVIIIMNAIVLRNSAKIPSFYLEFSLDQYALMLFY